MDLKQGWLKGVFPRRYELEPHLIRPFQQFFRKEAASSVHLLAATAAALVWANLPFGESYHHFWESEFAITIGGHHFSRTLREWIDEGLMTFFFFTVGLEIKRELLVGELASPRKALLPVGAAFGGMLFPALIYFLFNQGEPTLKGWGIPMATDIAFALGVLYILGKRVPAGLRIFLSAFAIADDLGAVLVIAIFYTETLVLNYLIFGLVIILIMMLASYFWIRSTIFYSLFGILLWFAVLGSGLHSTVVGIMVALLIPARGQYDTDRFLQEVTYYLGEFQCPLEGCGHSIMLNQRHLNAVQSIEMACHNVETPLQRLEQALHPWVAFLVIPLFALANAGLSLGSMDLGATVTSPVFLGIALGLMIGKPLGIVSFSFLFVRTGLAALPASVRWPDVLGAGILGGIGFTMSLFLAALSFKDPALLENAKSGILAASLIAGISGLLLLRLISSHRPKGQPPETA